MALDYRRLSQGLILETNASTPTITGSIAFDGTNLLIKPSGAVQTLVTDLNTVTLQNKTISGSSNTLSNIAYTSLSSMTSAQLASLISDETGTGSLVFATSPSLVTPSLGVATATSINSTTIPTSKTLVVTTDKLSALSATTSAELAGVISDETGSGSLVFATSPTLSSPSLTTPSTDVLTLDGQASTPANPSSGFYKAYVKDSTQKLTILDSSGVETTVGTGAGSTNYITANDGSVIGDWVTYADAAASSPVDGI